MGRKKLTDEQKRISREKRLQYLREYQKEHWREYYQNNKEKILEQQKRKKEEIKGSPLRNYNRVNLKGMNEQEKKEYYNQKVRESRARRKNNMKEHIHIDDEEEFLRQKEQYIYDSKQYIELKILVGHGDSTPISKCDGHDVDDEDIARLICAMKSQLEWLMKHSPTSFIIAEHMTQQNYNDLFKGEDTNEE